MASSSGTSAYGENAFLSPTAYTPFFTFSPESVLNLDKGNFDQWKTEVEDALALSPPFGLFVMGPVPQIPDKILNPDGYATWIANDRLARTLLRRTISSAEVDATKDASTAHIMWSRLLQRHGVLAPFEQAKLLKEATSAVFSPNIPIEDTITKIAGSIQHLYKFGSPKEEDLVFMTLLNALNAHYGMVRGRYLDAVLASGHPSVDSLKEHIRSSYTYDLNKVPYDSPQTYGHIAAHTNMFRVAAHLRDYSTKEFFTPGVFAMGSDWAKVEIKSAGSTFRATTAKYETYTDNSRFSPKCIDVYAQKSGYRQARVEFIIVSSAPFVDLRITQGNDEAKKDDRKGWASVTFLDVTRMNQCNGNSENERKFCDCPLNYNVKTPAILNVESDWGEIMLKSKHTSICKDPYANEAIYEGVEFTMTGLKFVSSHGLGDFKIPFIFVNRGEPVDYTIMNGQDAEKAGDKLGKAFVQFE